MTENAQQYRISKSLIFNDNLKKIRSGLNVLYTFAV